MPPPLPLFPSSSYVQMPVPEIALQVALAPHCASAACWSRIGSVGEHVSAQRLPPEDDCSAHDGAAVTPAGTSAGQSLGGVQAGEQNTPPRPVMLTASSSGRQPVLGSP